MRKIIRHTKFKSNPYGDGGDKRSAQIKEILVEYGVDFEDEKFELKKNSSVSTLVGQMLKGVVFILKTFKIKEFVTSINFIRIAKNFALRFPIIVDKYKNQKVLFLWESTVDGNYAYPYLFKSINQPIIALPHNLESLVPTQSDSFTGKSSPFWFEQELNRLALCDAVFTISREECWLLKLHGVNSFYLPYYPPREAEKLFQDVRDKRTKAAIKNPTKKILLLGSASNPPTFNGMKEIVSLFNEYNPNAELHIGGYSTESLKPFIKNDTSISLHGTLTNEELTNLMIETDAVLVHQQATTGALTRIPEMLIAGIPVIINADAARSFYDVNGITLYNSTAQLLEVLEGFESKIPDVYKRPDGLYKEFVNVVRTFSDK